VDNQHRQIKGYRDLSQHEIDLMNAIKAKGEELGALLNQLDTHLELQKLAAEQDAKDGKPNERTRLGCAQPYRWLAIARTDLQTGIMAAVRAIAQPTTF
jgi:hypothetical protein